MSTFRGLDGRLSLGGIVSSGSPLTQGTVAQGASSFTIDGGGGALLGVVLPGDKFTVAGDATVYTVVSGGAIGTVTPDELAVGFSPTVVPGGGWADNAAITFVVNRVGEITAWSCSTPRDRLEDSQLEDPSKTYKIGQFDWSGSARAWLDYDDPQQKKMIDEALAGSPVTVGLILTVSPRKQLFGQANIFDMRPTLEKSQLVEVQFDFGSAGDVFLSFDWNA